VGCGVSLFRGGGVPCLLSLCRMFPLLVFPLRAARHLPRSRAAACAPCSSGRADLARRWCSSLASPVCPPRARSRCGPRVAAGARWLCAQGLVVQAAPGWCLARWPGGLPACRPEWAAACLWLAGCAACRPRSPRPGCRGCPGGWCVLASAPVSSVPLVRLAPAPRWMCVCAGCGSPSARVLAGSGAGAPFAFCAACGVCLQAPARSGWRLAPPVPRGACAPAAVLPTAAPSLFSLL